MGNQAYNRNQPPRQDQRAVAVVDEPKDIRIASNDEVMYALVTSGDWSKLSPELRLAGYKAKCEAVGLDYMTQPFEFITFQGKTVLYPTKNATDQLRQVHGVTVEILRKSFDQQTKIYSVEARATDRNGRVDVDEAHLFVGAASGQDLANAYMKCVTKAKRRVTLAICGLGAMAEQAEQADDQGFERRFSIDLATGQETNNAPAKPVDQWRRMHGAAAARGVDHAGLKAIAASRYGRLASLKGLSSDELDDLEAYVSSSDTTVDDLNATIEDGENLLDDNRQNPRAWVESRRKAEIRVKVSDVVDDETDAPGDTVVTQDAEFVDEDGVIHGGQPADTFEAAYGADDQDYDPDVAAAADGVDEGAGPYDDPDDAGVNPHESAVLTWVGLIEECQSARDVRRVAKQIQDAGIEDRRIGTALNKATASFSAQKPVFGQPAQSGGAGDNRFTN